MKTRRGYFNRILAGLWVLIAFSGLHFKRLNAQIPGCGATVPYELINLTGNPDSTWVSDPIVRSGQCCGVSNPIRCLSFEVILDPNAAGIIMSSSEGALPPGSYFYEIGCGIPRYLDSVICLSGVGPHYISFCKPGGNTNIYQIRSIARPTFPADDTTRVGCFSKITCYGLDTNTVTWRSVFPGASGAYNSYLSATTNATTVNFSPADGSPPYIDYEICGQPSADECGYILYTCDTVRMYVKPALSVTVTPNPANFCASGSGVTLTAHPEGGDSNYTYQWKNPLGVVVGTGTSILAVMAGNYTLIVNDGLSSSTCGGVNHTITVTVTPDPVVNAGPDQTLCPVGPVAALNGTITNAPGGVWSGGLGVFNPGASTVDVTYTPTPAEIALGSLTLTLTSSSAGACPDVSDFVTLFFGDTLDVNIPPQALMCYGDSATLTASILSGNPPYTYEWTNGATTSSINVPAGVWCVTVTDQLNCSDVACFNLLTPPVLTATASGTDATVPLGSDGSASVAAAGGTPSYSYLWSTGGTTSSISGLAMGVYSVTVTDANGCSVVASAVVNDPRCAGFSASATGAAVDCNGQKDAFVFVNSVTGGFPPYSYFWQTSPVQANDTAFSLGAGTYEVIVQDGIGCSHMTTATVTEPPRLTNAMTQTNNAVIGGTSGTATANPGGGTPGYSYAWSDGQTAITATGLAAGMYYLTITDSKGCILTDSVLITEPPCNNLGVTILHTDVSCNSGSDGTVSAAVSGSVPPVTYLWNTGATTSSLTGLTAGNYSVTVTDSLNCTNFASHTLTEPSVLSLGLVTTHVKCFGGNDGSVDITVSGGIPPYQFQWSNGSASEDITLLLAGGYGVTVTDDNNCTVSGSTVINQPSKLTLVAVTDSVTCTGGADGLIDLTVSGGQPLYTYLWSNGSAAQDISSLTAGGYIVTVTDANNCILSKGYNIAEPDTLRIDTVVAACPAAGGTTADVTVHVSGGNGTSYEVSYDNGSTWGAPGDTTASLPLDSTYNILVRDGYGCLSQVYPFTILPAVVIDSVTYPLCSAPGTTSVTATVYPSGGDGGLYQVSWDGGTIWGSAGDYDATVNNGVPVTVVIRDARGCQGAAVLFTVPLPLVLITDSVSTFNCGFNVSCNGAANGSIFLTTAGGSSPYTSLWSDGSTSEDPSGLAAGTYSVTVTDNNACTYITGFTLTEPALLTASGTPATYNCGYNVTCNGATNGSIDITPAGGCAPYTYLWSNGSTSEDPSGLAAGAYSVTVTDNNGCTYITGFTLTEPALLTASGTPATYSCGYNVTCNGATNGSIDLTPAGGCAPYTYLWSNGSTSEDPSGLAAGAYSVTVTDNNACTFITGFTLTEPALLTASGIPATYRCGYNVTCNGATNGSIDLTPTGGCAPYTYLWSNGSTSEDPSGLAVGTYSVTVTDNNACTYITGFTLTEPALLTASGIPATYSCGYNVSGFGASDGSIDLTSIGGCAPYTYLWSNGSTSEDPSGLAAGTYSVTVTDNNGCTYITGFTLTEPALLTASGIPVTYNCGYNVTCNGATNGSIDLTPAGGCAPYTYLWSTTAITQDVSGLAAGSYSVTVTDANGNDTIVSFTLTEPALLTASGTPATYSCGYNVTCNGATNGSIDLTPSGGCAPYTYLWSNGSTSEDPSGLAAGTYSVTVTDNNACTYITGFTLTEPALLTASGIPATYNCGYNVTCNGATNGSIDLTPTGGCAPYTYLWSNGSTSEDPSGLSAGTYSVTVTDNNACTYITGFTLTEPALLTASGVPATYSCGYNVTCNGATNGSIDLTPSGGCAPYTYLWSNGSTSEDPSGLAAGTYSVTVTDNNACTYITGFTLTEPALLTASGIPATYNCGYNVTCNGATNGSIDLTPAGGCAPYTYLWSNGSTSEDPSGLAAGTYSVTVTDNNACTYITGFTITEPALLTASGVPATYSCGYNVTCNGATNGSIDITPAGGCAPYTYLWSNGSTSEDPSGLAAGTYSVTVTDNNACTYITGFTLTEPALLTASGTPATYSCGYNVTCNGATNGSIDLIPTGGCAPYTYLWSNGSTSEDPSGLAAGAYSVTVTDNNACTYITGFTLTEPALLTASGTPATYSCGYNVTCNGATNGSIDLTPAGGCAPYTYLWSDGSTSEDPSGLAAGTYSVTVTDNNACTYITGFTLTEPAILDAALVPASFPGGWNISCNGAADGSIDLTPSGGCAPYTYLWSDGDTLEDRSGLAAGWYAVSVTDGNGCSVSDSVLLTEPDTIASDINAFTFNGGWNISCNGLADGFADLTVTGGTAPYTYAWSNGSAVEDLAFVTAGTWYVTITDANGCSRTDSVTLTEPAPLGLSIIPSLYAGGFNISCNGAQDGSADLTVTGGTPGYLYLWSDFSFNEDLTGVGAGTYIVLVTDANGCLGQDTVTLSEPPAIALTASVTPASCAGGATGAVDLSVSGGVTPYTYNWSTGATSEDISGLDAGTYTVTVTDANGCTAVHSEVVTENSPIVLSAVVTDVSCNGFQDGAINLTASGGASPYTFIWSDGSVTEDLTGLFPGVYTVTVTDANTCTDTLSAIISQPAPIAVSAGLDYTTCDTDVLLIGNSPPPGGDGIWTSLVGSGVLLNPLDSACQVTGLSVGQNQFVWTITLGVCQASDTVLITLQAPEDCGPHGLEMPTAYSPNGDGRNDYFVVRGIEHYPDNEFTVFNRWGNQLYTRSGYHNEWNGQNASGGLLPDGTYFVILEVNGGEIVLHGYVDLRRE